MSSPAKKTIIQKLTDYLENRQKTNNFGTCRKCGKNVYWSTSKIASHIRSGHCKGASAEEVQKFKQEYVYDSPKHLIHRSSIGTTSKNENDKSENVVINIKRQKLDTSDSAENAEYRLIEENNVTEELTYELEQANTDDERVAEIVYYADDVTVKEPPSSSNTDKPADNKEEKFITVVYPQFKGRTKLHLIDEILDLQRRNELLQNKVKTYEDTINKLL